MRDMRSSISVRAVKVKTRLPRNDPAPASSLSGSSVRSFVSPSMWELSVGISPRQLSANPPISTPVSTASPVRIQNLGEFG